MGRGSSTKKQDPVVKSHPQEPSDSDAKATGASGTGPAGAGAEDAGCLLRFSTEQLLPSDNDVAVKTGDRVTLGPNPADGSLELRPQGGAVVPYTGPRRTTMKRCMIKGFVYEGTVTATRSSSDGQRISFKIQGRFGGTAKAAS